MGGMDLDCIEAKSCCPPCGIHEIVTDALEPISVERGRYTLALSMRYGRWSLCLPAEGLVWMDLGAALPWGSARGLSAGMGKLKGERNSGVQLDPPLSRRAKASSVSSE